MRATRRMEVELPAVTFGIRAGDLEKLPLTSGYAYTGEHDLARQAQKALQQTLAAWQQRLGRPPRLGVILDEAHR